MAGRCSSLLISKETLFSAVYEVGVGSNSRRVPSRVDASFCGTVRNAQEGFSARVNFGCLCTRMAVAGFEERLAWDAYDLEWEPAGARWSSAAAGSADDGAGPRSTERAASPVASKGSAFLTALSLGLASWERDTQTTVCDETCVLRKCAGLQRATGSVVDVKAEAKAGVCMVSNWRLL